MGTESQPVQIKDGCPCKQAVYQNGILNIHLTFTKTKNDDR